jgi:hypothetical protein
LKVGTRFVKEYYKTLSSQPDNLHRFYQPTSVLSAGVGSEPTQSTTFEVQAAANKGLKDRFVLEGYEESPIRFEFENGAIDAQMSVNAGVLLVVTGHIVYLPVAAGEEEDEEEADLRRKAFVHTFFLASQVAGSKRSYYVHNDVLRFLQDDEESTVVVSNTTTSAPLSVAVEEPPAVVVSSVPATPQVVPVVEEIVSPGGGVEESKDDIIAEEEEEEEEKEAPLPKEVKKPTEKAKHSKKEKYVKETKAPAPAKPTSWASMVASTSNGGAAPTSSNPSTPTRPTASATSSPAKAPKTPQAAATPPPVVATTEAPAPAATTKPTKPEPPPRKGVKPQRDPDCTLVIKNFDASSTTEADIRALFDGFATETETKVVGCTVSAHKALAFVDYDSAKPVLAAVEKHKQEPMQLKGTTLEIYQKTQDYQKPQNRRSQGGRGNVRGGPGGGRQYRRSGSGGGGRGDRGGGGGRGRGRGGP